MEVKHYFIIAFDDEMNTWDWDTEQEEGAFPEGTVVDEETNDWFSPYLGDGEYIETEERLAKQLNKYLELMSEELRNA